MPIEKLLHQIEAASLSLEQFRELQREIIYMISREFYEPNERKYGLDLDPEISWAE